MKMKIKELYQMESDFIYPFNSYNENVADSGCYYLSPEICKDIIISAGVSGIHTPKAIKKMRYRISHAGDAIEDILPAFRYMNREIIITFAGEFAQCMVEAAELGKGVEVVIGYPKVLIFKVV